MAIKNHYCITMAVINLQVGWLLPFYTKNNTMYIASSEAILFCTGASLQLRWKKYPFLQTTLLILLYFIENTQYNIINLLYSPSNHIIAIITFTFTV